MKKPTSNPILLVQMFLPLLIFFMVLFFVAQLAGRLMIFSRRDMASMNFTALAMNSPLSLAIAVVMFPERTLISLALIVGQRIELPVLSIISGILKRWISGRSECISQKDLSPESGGRSFLFAE